MPIVNRERELALLSELLMQPGPTLVLVTGRRRVGKTFLLSRAWPSESTFLFTATETTPEQNRRQLVLDAAAWSGEDMRPEDYPTWRAVFDRLWRLREPQPLVIVLDEFQYFATGDRGLAEVTSAINATLEGQAVNRPFVLVLSGSAVSTMESLASGGAPLFGRLATHVRLEPLEAYDTADFVPAWSLRDKASAYGILGGTPAYWAALDPKSDLRRNVARLLLAPPGTLRLQLDTLLTQKEGLGDTAAYNAIVRAVAGGATTRPRIADASGLKPDTSLLRRLNRLVEVGLLSHVDVIEAPAKSPVRYRLADPALRFYHVFISPYSSLLERSDPLKVYDEVVLPRLDTFLGLAFEGFVAPTYERLSGPRSLPMVQRWSRWEGHRVGQSVEVDVVAPLVDKRVMTGSVKFSSRPIGPNAFFDHLDAVRRVAEAGLRWANLASRGGPLFFLSAAGFTDRFRDAARSYEGSVLTWSLDDVYAPANTRTGR
ncbi:MAG TPA: ATP-binding protein [Trueperaceae bacterium]|nr:ATP-binding protein [Trueperaceae bacterium]